MAEERPHRLSRRRFLAGGLGAAGAGMVGAIGPARAAEAKTKAAGSDLGCNRARGLLDAGEPVLRPLLRDVPGVNGFDPTAPPLTQAWPAGRRGATTLLPFNLASPTAQLCVGNDAIPTHDWVPQHASLGGRRQRRLRLRALGSRERRHRERHRSSMGYFTRKQLAFYYALADAYTICDNYFCSVLGPTHPPAVLHDRHASTRPAATAGRLCETAGLPTANWSARSPGTRCPRSSTEAGVSWKMYQPPGLGGGLRDTCGPRPRVQCDALFPAVHERPVLGALPEGVPANLAERLRRTTCKHDTLPQVSWVLPPVAYSGAPEQLAGLGASG